MPLAKPIPTRSKRRARSPGRGYWRPKWRVHIMPSPGSCLTVRLLTTVSTLLVLPPERPVQGQRLQTADRIPDDEFIEHLKTLSPPQADIELRSLSTGNGDAGHENEMSHFVRALTARLTARKDYELTQAWMSVFLKLHFDEILEDEMLLEALGEWKKHQAHEQRRLDDLVGYCGGVVGFLRSPRTWKGEGEGCVRSGWLAIHYPNESIRAIDRPYVSGMANRQCGSKVTTVYCLLLIMKVQHPKLVMSLSISADTMLITGMSLSSFW